MSVPLPAVFTAWLTSSIVDRVPRARKRDWRAAGIGLAALALFAGPLAASSGTAASAGGSTTRTLLSVVSAGDSIEAVAQRVTALGGRVLSEYPIADALLVALPPGAQAPVGTVAVRDIGLHVASVSTATVGDIKGATYRNTIGADPSAVGAGVTVAVVDTGVADVADLAGRLTHLNVSGGPAGDGLGHGTFLAGLIAGDGASSGGRYTGVAPAANILDVQVAGGDGSTSLSRVLAGLQAVSDAAAGDPSLRVVSLALSTGSPIPPSVDPLARALDQLWARGLTVVVAAGNDGPADGTVTSPGADPLLVTVGALDEHATSNRSDDTVPDFSSRGTAFGVDKPDLVAPGVSLISTRAPGSAADVENPNSRVGDSYFTGTGTSMSEAVAAGAVADLIGAHPGLTPDSVKWLLTSTAYRTSGLGPKVSGAGAGGLDLGAALAAAPTAPRLHPGRWLGARASDNRYGPDPADAAAWTRFSGAWAAGDLPTVAAAWVSMSERTRRWAGTAFALDLVATNAGADDATFAAVDQSASRWATQGWNSRAWATDAFVAHSWDAHSWDAHSWDAHSWDAHSWASADWLAFAWSAHSWASSTWAADAWANQVWSAGTWSAHSWATFAWSAHSWAAHSWAANDWSAHSWAALAWPTT